MKNNFKTKIFTQLFLLSMLSACLGGDIRGFGGNDTGNPDATINEDIVVAKHCAWVSHCSSEITASSCVIMQQESVFQAVKHLNRQKLKMNPKRYETISCWKYRGDFTDFSNKETILNFWRNESFMNNIQ